MDYIIVDSNNNWVSTGKNASPEELKEDITDTIERMMADGNTEGELLVFQTVGEPTSVKYKS